MALALKALFHLLPLVPLWYHRPFGTIAAVLFVLLPYIKVKKLEADLAEAKPAREIKGLEKTIRFWRAFTFLPRAAAGSPPPPPGTP